MTTEADFMRAICAEPERDDVRLVLADWLDEQGQESRGEFLRVQIELSMCRDGVESCPTPEPRCGRCKGCVLREREIELFAMAGPGQLEWFGPAHRAIPAGVEIATLLPWFARGLLSRLTCTSEAWLEHADAITAGLPIEEVELTTLRDFIGAHYRAPGNERAFYEVYFKERWPRVKFKLPKAIFMELSPWPSTHGTTLRAAWADETRNEPDGDPHRDSLDVHGQL